MSRHLLPPESDRRFIPGTAAWVTRGVVAIALLLLLAGCDGHSTRHTAPVAKPSLFADDGAPLRYVDRGVISRPESMAVHDVSYESLGLRVDGYLVEPPGGGRKPAIVLVHGSGADRRELLGSAVALARAGAVALTITAPSSSHPPAQPATIQALLSESRTTTVRDAVAVRRAADVLDTLPTVDPHRLGYLGWSSGAKTGAFVAASDRRFRALVLLSAGAETLTSFAAAAPAADRALVRRQLAPIDPIAAIARARPGTILLEDGTRDSIVPHTALENIVRAAPARTVVRWYPTDHGLNDAAYRAAFAWLAGKLGVKK